MPTFEERYEESLIKQLFESEIKKAKEKLLDENDDEADYFEDQRIFQHQKRDGEWDVPIDEEIKYFDPELSYEITGYRPINMTDGLDFNPEPFRAAAECYEKNKYYTSYLPGSKPYKEYWKEQLRRCAEGYTVGKYRITGDHYFFLNFYRMQTVNLDSTKKTTGRGQSFPSFLSKQYEFFHYLEICEHIGKDCIMLKARGLGFSEILACIGVRPFITTREFTTIYTAAADNQLSPVLDKCWTQMDWLNMNTNGGMKRSRMKVNNAKEKKASLLTSDNIEYGRMSSVKGIVADVPRKIRGERVERLIFEEIGSNPVSVTSWIQGNALVELGGTKIGTRIGGGTGGDSGPQLEGLARMFNNPLGFNVLPYKNSHTRDGKIAYTGFFIPAHEFALKPEFLDNRGVTDSIRFRKHYEDQRALMEGKDLLTYCAEHCFTPDEALLRQGDNIFNSELISERLTQIRVHKQGIKPKNVVLEWADGEKRTKVKAHEVKNKSNNTVTIFEEPLIDNNGDPYKNLYVAGIDAIDMGTSDSASDYDVSDFCIVIKRRVFGQSSPKYVAIYKARPSEIKVAFETTMRLLVWYNCKAMLEYTKISIQKYFESFNKGHLFMSRPEFAVSSKTRTNQARKKLIGLPATEAVIKHGLELISMYVDDYWYEFDHEDTLEQLLNYSYEAKRKFDIIAAMSCCEIAEEELTGITPAVINSISREWKDFGYYTDENGIKRKGVLPR